jgi:ribonuclease VapC
MTAFVDASVLVAILGGEPDSRSQIERLQHSGETITSPVAIWEAVTALIRRYGFDPERAGREVATLIAVSRTNLVPIDAAEGEASLDAYRRYGKGQHDARLNMGDCFAYACAKTNGATLLYKGDDFSKTDLA